MEVLQILAYLEGEVEVDLVFLLMFAPHQPVC